MLSGYLIEKYNNMADAYTSARLLEESRKLGIRLNLIGVHDTLYNDGILTNSGRTLEKCDFVINRYKWGFIKDVINSLAPNSYNQLSAYKPYINKYTQIINISSSYFAKPKFVLGTTQSNYDRLTELIGYPFIAKGLESSMGREIRLIQRADDLNVLLKEFGPEREILFEEFIKESYGRDLRLFSIRGEAIACMKRESSDDFRANVALGAGIKRYPIDETLQSIASDIYHITGLDVIGIDLLFGRDGYYFCEINVMPGLEGIEQASGLNIAKYAMELIVKDLN